MSNIDPYDWDLAFRSGHEPTGSTMVCCARSGRSGVGDLHAMRQARQAADFNGLKRSLRQSHRPIGRSDTVTPIEHQTSLPVILRRPSMMVTVSIPFTGLDERSGLTSEGR